MNFTEKIEEILQKEAQAILDIQVTDQFEKAVELIVEQVHRKGGKLVTSGMGKAGQIAMNIATTFCSTGTPAVFLHPSEAQHGDLGILQKNDLMLVISNLMPELKFIVITGNNRSELAQRADVCLFTGAPGEVCPLGLTPTTSTTLMTVIGDILVVGAMEATHFDAHQYALRHHGGYLGTRSREQSQNK